MAVVEMMAHRSGGGVKLARSPASGFRFEYMTVEIKDVAVYCSFPMKKKHFLSLMLSIRKGSIKRCRFIFSMLLNSSLTK